MVTKPTEIDSNLFYVTNVKVSELYFWVQVKFGMIVSFIYFHHKIILHHYKVQLWDFNTKQEQKNFFDKIYFILHLHGVQCKLQCCILKSQTTYSFNFWAAWILDQALTASVVCEYVSHPDFNEILQIQTDTRIKHPQFTCLLLMSGPFSAQRTVELYHSGIHCGPLPQHSGWCQHLQKYSKGFQWARQICVKPNYHQ